MKTISLSVYTIDELSPEAKAKAISSFRDSTQDSWSTIDAWNTCLAIEKVFSVIIGQLDLSGYNRNAILYNISDSGKTFADYQKQFKYPSSPDCGLTGVYTDCPFLNALPKEGILTSSHIENALLEAVKSWKAEYEYEFSDEGIKERIRVNEYNFLEAGTIYNII